MVTADSQTPWCSPLTPTNNKSWGACPGVGSEVTRCLPTLFPGLLSPGQTCGRGTGSQQYLPVLGALVFGRESHEGSPSFVFIQHKAGVGVCLPRNRRVGTGGS